MQECQKQEKIDNVLIEKVLKEFPYEKVMNCFPKNLRETISVDDLVKMFSTSCILPAIQNSVDETAKVRWAMATRGRGDDRAPRKEYLEKQLKENVKSLKQKVQQKADQPEPPPLRIASKVTAIFQLVDQEKAAAAEKAAVAKAAAAAEKATKEAAAAAEAKKPGLLTRLWNGIKGIGSAIVVGIVGVFKSKPAEAAPPAQEVVEARPLEEVMAEKVNEEVTVTAPVTVKVKLSHVQDFNLQRNPDANVMKKGEPDKKDKPSRETQRLKDLRRSAKVEVKNNQDPLKEYEIKELRTYTEEQKNELLSKIQSDAAKRGELEQYFHQGGFRNLAQDALQGYMESQNQAFGLKSLTEKYIFEVQDNGDIRFTESYQIAEIRAQPDLNAEVGQLMKPTIPATGTVTLTSTLSWDSKGALQVKSGDLILESTSPELTESFKTLKMKVEKHQRMTSIFEMLTEDPLGAESSFTELQPPSKTLLRQAEEEGGDARKPSGAVVQPAAATPGPVPIKRNNP